MVLRKNALIPLVSFPLSRAQSIICPVSIRTRLLCWSVFGVLCSASGCNPFERHEGSYSAGAVDPSLFPPPYLGTGGDGKRPGSGRFQYVTAYVHGNAIAYYPLPFHGRQATAQNPLDLSVQTLPLAYHFDPDRTPDGADSRHCVAPSGYTFDQQARRRYAVPSDRQGNVFTALPTESDPPGRTAYVPVVREVVVRSEKNPCQDPKSERSLISRDDLSIELATEPAASPEDPFHAIAVGKPSGRFLMWALIDPAAEVLFPSARLDPVTQLGPQRFGWYNQYLTAYLDGGVVPIETISPHGKTIMKTQRLLYPTRVFDRQNNSITNGGIGMGFDLLEFSRGDEGYSPVCRVYSFEPVKPESGFEKSLSEVNLSHMTDTGRVMYCPQPKY